MKPEIKLSDGSMFSFVDLFKNEYKIEEIALALSREQRWGNQIPDKRVFYSVAEHSVYVASLCPSPNKMAALLHDAHEFVMKDLPSPLKHMPEMQGYRDLCDRIQADICSRFNCFDHTNSAKPYDLVLMETEHLQFFGTRMWVAEPLRIRLAQMKQEDAYNQFMKVFKMYYQKE